ncbi:S-layer homology domain-containing protein [Fusibacter tunisiensis]|uniref:SLH domain-containing protein n=1 Tax=Fusibacter tunisiensis TaxID=1008308 RepID=A0ABS2MN63_9FIRM|nr:S-layer homology domain-containing protein [Fusibacter tunisiensis]MBM7560825.1 hypothetical protein [Fusibacter tunisiensis]
MKQKLSLILVVLLLMTSVPAMANNTKSGGQNLYDFNFIQGSDTGLDEDKPLTRSQAAKLLAQMYGKDDEAKQTMYTQTFLDVISSDWYAPYVAYANKNGWISGYPGGTFKPDSAVTRQEWAKMLIAALGYTYTWETAVADLEKIDITIEAENPGALLRGEAFEAMWKAVNTNRFGQELSLGQEFGMLPLPEPEVPETPEITGVEIYSLKELVLKVNVPLDVEAAETTGNYVLKSEAVYDLEVVNASYNVEKGEITLIFNKAVPQQSDVALILGDIKSLEGELLINDAYRSINIGDFKLPEIVSATALGNRAVKLVFSEPMMTREESDLVNDEEQFEYGFTLNEGRTIVKSYELQNFNKELIIETYTDLPEKTEIVPKKHFDDYASFNLLSNPNAYPIEITVVKDSVAPKVIGYENVSSTGVTLVWSEDIKVLNGAQTEFYHSSVSNRVDATVTSEHIDGHKLRLDFSKNFIPSGTTWVVVDSGAIQDYSGNRNTVARTQIELAPDTVAPYIEGEATPISEQRIKLKVSEPLNNRSGQVQNRLNYELLDGNGTNISGQIVNVIYNSDVYTIEIVVLEPIIGTFTLIVNGLEDYSGNVIRESRLPFEIRDFTAPDPEKWTARLYEAGKNDQVVRIKFDEPMAIEGKYSVLDPDKYKVNGKLLSALDDDLLRMTMADDRTLEIHYPGEIVRGGLDFYADDNTSTSVSADVEIGRVADLDDNFIHDFSVVVDLSSEGTLSIVSASQIDQNLIEIVVSDELVTFDLGDLRVEDSDEIYRIIDSERVYEDNRTKLILKLDDPIVGDPSGVTVQAVRSNSVNRYGEAFDLTAPPLPLADKMAPYVVETTLDGRTVPNVTYSQSTGIVTIRFSEDIDPETVSRLSFSILNIQVENIGVNGRDVRLYVKEEDQSKVQLYTPVIQNVEIRDYADNGVEGLDLSVQKID